jgi:hypothetical protein
MFAERERLTGFPVWINIFYCPYLFSLRGKINSSQVAGTIYDPAKFETRRIGNGNEFICLTKIPAWKGYGCSNAKTEHIRSPAAGGVKLNIYETN